ncbi:arylesterase [Caulobacter sp. CCNWLY153]|uniref:arylesterase n=1 Tax=unclassified Caulobacter TaxID=2648921 RepID=UPI002FF3D493
MKFADVHTLKDPNWGRREILAGLLALPAGPVLAAPRVAAPPRPPVVTVLGDSITAGLGVRQGEAMPARLQAVLAARGLSVQVRAAGRNGDTSAGGLARLEAALGGDTAVCVVALGGNDLLQGLRPEATRANLRAILTRLRERQIPAAIAGVNAPALLGADYARRFNAVFTDLARDFAAPLLPNLLAGIGGSRRYMQSDGIHPNAEGARVIAANLAPVVVQALARSAQVAAR